MAKAAAKKPTVTVATSKEEKLKALNTAMGNIERNYGKGAIMRLSDNANMEVQAVHTGSLLLDAALGIGGVPRGRITEIFGPESSGKTTVALHIIAEVQKEGGIAAFIDAEHALDPSYAKALGVNIDDLLISQPDCGEDALEITETLVRSGAVDVVVIDSVAALVPRQELDGDMGANSVGVQARLMSKAMRKLASVIAKSNAVVVFINQLREKVGVMYGNPETTTGGRALKFAASVRIDIRKADQLKQGSEVYGNKVKCKIVKNKVAPPFKVAEFDILYGRGISIESELIELALKLDIIQKSGSWLSYNGERLGQGKDNVRKLLFSNQDLFAEIEAKVRANMANIVPDEELSDEEDEDEFDLDLLSDDDE
ncbi:MAG: recombinase RecA [Ruminococcaceae bacterium]|nr:recombinase RecA [Oscillospiraceae bacterium]MBO4972563.1 recombinase RecA [Clostridia bacterium]MBQ1260088.1 recombinase RecA [Clostridia bacterium]